MKAWNRMTHMMYVYKYFVHTYDTYIFDYFLEHLIFYSDAK